MRAWCLLVLNSLIDRYITFISNLPLEIVPDIVKYKLVTYLQQHWVTAPWKETMSAAILFRISSEFRSTPLMLTDNITERKFKEVDEIDFNNIVNKKISVLVWKFLDSVMYRDVKLNDNAGSVKCKHVWDIGVQLECIKKALFTIENGGVHWLNNYPVHGWVLVTSQHHMITDNMNVKPPLFDPNSQRDHIYDIKAAPRRAYYAGRFRF